MAVYIYACMYILIRSEGSHMALHYYSIRHSSEFLNKQKGKKKYLYANYFRLLSVRAFDFQHFSCCSTFFVYRYVNRVAALQ